MMDGAHLAELPTDYQLILEPRVTARPHVILKIFGTGFLLTTLHSYRHRRSLAIAFHKTTGIFIVDRTELWFGYRKRSPKCDRYIIMGF